MPLRSIDRTPGPSDEEETIYETNASPTGGLGSVSQDGTSFVMVDSVGAFNPRTGGSGVTEPQHDAYDKLLHNIQESAFDEVVRAGQVTDVITWTDSGKTTKIRETSLTRAAGQVSSIVEKQYNGAGTLVQTRTGTVTRVSGQVSTVDWVLT